MALGGADGKIVIETALDNNGFNKGVDSIKSKVNGLKGVVGKLGAVIASAFAVKSLINFGKECIELGSNVAEVQNVVDTAFGDMAYKAEEFANSAIQNFGMSTLAAKKTASTYMAMAKGMGLNAESASEMAISLAGLTGDVASFYNISQELADVKLKSVFTGETESLKDLGVVMTQANLKAFALEQGISKDMSAMSQAELVGLRYNYVLNALSLASGDFAKTSDSWANQTRILSMQWQEFMSVIGQAMTTVLLPVVRVLNQIVSQLISAAKAASAFVSSLLGIKQQQSAEGAAAVSEQINSSVEGQEALTDATKETTKATEEVADAQSKAIAGFDEINKLSTGGAGALPSVEADSSSVGDGLGAAAGGGLGTLASEAESLENSGVLSFLEKLKNAVAPFRDSFVEAIAKIEAGLKKLGGVFVDIWQDLGTLGEPLRAWASGPLVTLINQIIYTVGNTLGGLLDSVALVLGDVWNIVIFPTVQKWAVDILPAMTEFSSQILSTFDVLFNESKISFDRIWGEALVPALAMAQSIWSDAWDGILNVWDEYGAPIFEKVREAIENTSSYMQNAWETIGLPVWNKIMDVVGQLWSEHLKPLWDNFLDFVAVLVDGALDIYNKFIMPLANWFVDNFGGHIREAFSGAIEIIGGFLGMVIDVASSVIDSLKGVVNFLVGVFTGDWERAWNGIVDFFKGIINGLIVIVEYLANCIVKAINKMISSVNSVSFDVPDWVPGIGGGTFGFDIPLIKEVSIPRLAQGAVIPPNREFMAVLGDQKSGTNIETPLATMVQAFRMALQDMGGGQSEAVMVIDDEVFARLVYRLNSQESHRIGVNLAGG